MTSPRLSVLDLTPFPSGSTAGTALRESVTLAQHVEALGYHRFWLAEHHNTGALACPAPEILIGQVAAATRTLRVGSGGVMLPNYSPLKVAEWFRVLEALHPGRIDLGIGRAPGTDQRTSLALRRSPQALMAEDFPDRVQDLLAYLEDAPTADGGRAVLAMPTGVPAPPVWMLGSSTFGARLAATLGLGFAFAYHIDPAPALAAFEIYRTAFRPTPRRESPEAILAVSAICGESRAHAEDLASSGDLLWVRFLGGDVHQRVPSVAEARAYAFTAGDRAIVGHVRSRLLLGTAADVAEQARGLARAFGASEVMVTTVVHDTAERRASYTRLMEAWRG
ncbi:N5,N10-methylene tetrahydromethanopterin reductase [Luteitalea sp. TBR-22]|uniref:LLM class flavin-dependent oxidoreductase n=1 Tax=Luteitalea sp. TBR-22 TaxID=2802971 RepID=UPI001AFC0D76|nr:LLM class flavin-dependent oxidoreductase [Luteitalea sp. TBR-22]BCS33680.1 N5,N10-methylene tetrahydromethanopterin reductase [Luteitalea sp. TBR-22]